jgi:hypothetical protein
MVSTLCTVHSVTRRAVFHIYVFTDPINKQTMNKCVFTRKRFQIILFDFKPHAYCKCYWNAHFQLDRYLADRPQSCYFCTDMNKYDIGSQSYL